MDKLLASQIIKTNNRVTAANVVTPSDLEAKQDKLTAGSGIKLDGSTISVKGADVWEDMTSELTASIENTYFSYSADKSLIGIQLKITIEGALVTVNNLYKTYEISLFMKPINIQSSGLRLNCISIEGSGYKNSQIIIETQSINYYYGDDLSRFDAANRPKITKVERLVE